jgi:hypothetical protein
MRRIRLVVAAVAAMVAMLALSVPAMADVDFDGNRHGDRYENKYDRYEDLADEYYDALGEVYDDGVVYYSPLIGYDLDDIEDIEEIVEDID